MAEMMLDMGVEDEEQFERNRTRPHSRSLQESYQNLMVASREERAKAERHRMQRQAQIQLLQNSPKASDQEKAREVLRKRSGSSALLRASVKKMVAGKNAVSRINSLARSVSSSSPKARKASDFEDRPSSRIGRESTLTCCHKAQSQTACLSATAVAPNFSLADINVCSMFDDFSG